VTAALSKAYQGKFAALTKLGIPMSDSIQNASDYAKEMVKLNRLQADAANTVGPDHVKAMEKVALQQEKVNAIAADGIDWQSDLAGAFANSAEKAANIDPYQRMQIIFGEIQEKLGSALLPVLDQFATWMASPPGQKTLQEVADAASNVLTELTKTAKWAIENKDWLLPLVAGVGVFKTTVTAIGTITAAVNGVTAAVNALKIATGGTLLASLGALGIGAVGAGVGGYQQGTTLGKTADIYSGGAKQTTDPFSGLGKIGNNGFVAPKTTPNVTINVTEPKATAADIIRKLDDYYKATGTRLSY
jgi:hypothetical protein